MDKVRRLIKAGIQQYCNDLANELGYHEPNRDISLLLKFHEDADGIADYIMGGLRNAHIVGVITDDPAAVKPRRYTDEDFPAWSDH
jgi:hypothetical protein